MYIDKRYIYIIMAVFVVMGFLRMTDTSLLGLLLTLPGLLIAITFHEYAHAFAADKLGDDTPRRQGRLNLNPVSHLDPVGSVLLLFAGFGWGKPVQINPRKFDRKVTMEQGEAIVSVAGPAMNMILALIFTIIYCILIKFFPQFVLGNKIGNIIGTMVYSTIITNIGLGIFNLIPLPPLDGSKIFINFMPYNAKMWIRNHEQIFQFIFILIWVTGIAGTIISPIIGAIGDGIFWLVGKLFGL